MMALFARAMPHIQILIASPTAFSRDETDGPILTMQSHRKNSRG
jgi:hypothetical protein